MTNNLNQTGDIIGLDVGDVRVGVARANNIAKIPEPLDHLINNQEFITNFKDLINRLKPILIVVGMPYSAGVESNQSQIVEKFVDMLKFELDLPIVIVDESFTSKDADEFLKNNKKSNFSQDSVAACYILSEYFKMEK